MCTIKVQKHDMAVVNYYFYGNLLVKLLAHSNSGTRLVDCVLERERNVLMLFALQRDISVRSDRFLQLLVSL